jgi:putative addiction module component (TIGR02574 family)
VSNASNFERSENEKMSRSVAGRDERIKLVEDLWDSIAAEQNALPLTARQRAELDRRLDAFELDKNRGRRADEVIADIGRRL